MEEPPAHLVRCVKTGGSGCYSRCRVSGFLLFIRSQFCYCSSMVDVYNDNISVLLREPP